MTPSELALILALVRKEAAKVKPADGLPGANGVDGITGPQGDPGSDGIDAVLPDFTITNGHLFAGAVDLGAVVGRDGQDGANGQDGADGHDGVDGRDGTNGRNGKDGLNGVGIREIYVDPDDGHIYVEFTNGRVTDAGLVKGKDGKPGRDGKSGHGGGLVVQSGGGSGIAETFETVSKNLSASGAVMGYTDGDLTTVTYSNGIVKTLAYSLDGLSSVTLSGNTPGGIALVKTLQYNSPDLSGFTYS